MNQNEYKKKELKKILNLIEVKKYGMVIAKAKPLINKFPKEYIFYNALGMALINSGRFKESLKVLQLLLSEENVSWHGKYYKFDPITIMPRPISQPIPIMIAAMDLDSIRNAAKKGYHVQSTVLSGSKQLLLERANAFRAGCAEHGEKGKLLKLSMQRLIYAAKDEEDAKEKNKMAYEYYKRFDNMFTGPGQVDRGLINPLPRKQSLEELTENLLICPPSELIDKLSVYVDAGINEIIVSASFGQSQNDIFESMYRISEKIIPLFKKTNIKEA